MTNSLRYTFVSGASDVIQQSWQHFQSQRADQAISESVSFIPAMGGCFLVLANDAPPVAPHSLTQRLRPLTGRLTAVDLQEFKEAFESGLTPVPDALPDPSPEAAR